MRIENINKENIKQMVPVELRNTKVRFIHIYENHFSDPTIEKAVGLTRDIFINKYLILRNEMKSRGVEYMEDSALDKVKEVNVRSFLKSIYNIDVPDLAAVEIIKSYVAISGAFMLMPKSAKAVDVVVRNVEKNKDVALEKKIGMIIKAHTGREPNFIYKPEGPNKTYMPVFDLVLKACDEVNVIKVVGNQGKKDFNITKPEETDNTIRIPAGPECEVTATITISADEGIKALYCGKVKQVRTYLFDKAKGWTMDKAKAWVKAAAEKTKGMQKKLSTARQKEYDVETAKIRENAKAATYPHKFKAAEWTWPNGHPRCIHCGDEELVDKKGKSLPCEKPVAKFTISKIDKKQQIVGGVVYEPNEVDTQGDYTDAKEIEKAQIRFMEKYATDTKRARISHKGRKLFFPIIECFIPEHDTMKGSKQLKAGSWWLEMKVTNPAIWKLIESGELDGFSMGGRAKA